jgi:hypothetical protein
MLLIQGMGLIVADVYGALLQGWKCREVRTGDKTAR